MYNYEDVGYPCRVAFALPAPLHVQLTSRPRRRLHELRRDPALTPRERDRVAMYLLSADGMTVPARARHWGGCEATMRRWIRQFEAEGLKAVRHKRRVVRRALNGLLSQKRTWTAAQLAAALAEKGLAMKPPTVCKYLHLMGASYRRTQYSLRHRQDPARVAAARTELDDLKKKPAPGPVPVLAVGGVHDHGQPQPQGVDHQVALAALDLLAGVVAPGARLDRYM